MENLHPLMATIVFSVVFAFILGFVASNLKLPTIIGYITAGILLSPNTPGVIADIEIAKQLAEIGVILLMFNVGLHFSTKDLIRVKKIAVLGALSQMLITTLLCSLLAINLNYNVIESIIFGISLSIASTVVMLRVFDQFRLNHTDMAKIAIGWLVVEDIIMILILVLIPSTIEMLRNNQNINLNIISYNLSITLIKITLFVIAMITIGKKILPIFLLKIFKLRSRELVSLSILAIASGCALIANLIFGASFALGAFLAGFVLNNSFAGRRAVEKSVTLRDIFSVIFFISVGLIFNPKIIIQEPLLVIFATLLVIFGKSFIAFIIMKIFKKNTADSLVLSASLAQIGEFSFILVAMAIKLKIISQTLYDMVIISSIISITLNPFLFKIALSYQDIKKKF